MSIRPRLVPGARVLLRSATSVQVGTSLRDGLVFEGVSAHEIAYLQALADPHSANLSTPPRGPAIVRALAQGGLLRDPRPHKRRRVAILGDHPLAHTLADALTTGGHRVTTRQSTPPGQLDCAVLIGVGAISEERDIPWTRAGVTVLPVALEGASVTIGPILRDNGPCLRCLHLHQAQLDPRWPELAAQTSNLTCWNSDPATLHASATLHLAAAATLHTISGIFEGSHDEPCARTWTLTAAPSSLPVTTHPRCTRHPQLRQRPASADANFWETLAV